MNVIFVSNFLNMHQIPVSDELYKRLGTNYHFIQMEEMTDERKNMGWEINENKFPYLIKYNEQSKLVEKLVDTADVVIHGGTSDFIIKKRIRENKLVIKYDERPFRKNDFEWLNPRRFRAMLVAHRSCRKKNVYLLCAGAYVKKDMQLFGAYPHKMYKWGYFPRYYDYGEVGPQKETSGVLSILWSGRMIELKHAEYAIMCAEHLKSQNKRFHLTMIGKGELLNDVKKTICAKGLSDEITVIEQVSHEEMAKKMLEADIFLATSDRREGWCAVVQEAMNQGCVVIANKMIGSVPWLISNKKNGFFYKKKNDFISIIEMVADLSRQEQRKIGFEAYKVIKNTWNSTVASQHLMELCSYLLKHEGKIGLVGPCETIGEKTWKRKDMGH